MFEGMWITLREGIEAAIVVVLVVSYLRQNNRAWLTEYFYLGLALGILIAMALTFFFNGLEMLFKNQLIRFIILLDGLLFFSALLAFIRSLGGDLFAAPALILARFRVLQGIMVALGASLLVFFDVLGVALQLKSLADIKENPVTVYSAGVLGVAPVLVLGAYLVRFCDRVKLGRLFTPASLILSIFTVKLLGGGVNAFSEAMIPFVQQRLIKLGHDIVHTFIVLFLFPDHPFVKTEFWNFVGYFFNEKTILSLIFVVLGGPVILLIWKVLTSPLPTLAGVSKGAERRRQLAGLKKERWLQFIPVAVAFVTILSFLIAAGASQVEPVYEPEPQPVVDDGNGVISVALAGPVSDIADGRLHKWSYRINDKTILFMAIKRPDGVVAITLDVCGICQPEGYSQIGDKYLLCKYCKTPIPISSVGEPGGCNPVPLRADVGGQNLRITVEELVSQYDQVMRGK